jgi:hypothetical protein
MSRPLSDTPGAKRSRKFYREGGDWRLPDKQPCRFCGRVPRKARQDNVCVPCRGVRTCSVCRAFSSAPVTDRRCQACGLALSGLGGYCAVREEERPDEATLSERIAAYAYQAERGLPLDWQTAYGPFPAPT